MELNISNILLAWVRRVGCMHPAVVVDNVVDFKADI